MTDAEMPFHGRTGPRRVVIITGVPRSGTTVLNALLCTSPQTNPLIGEASYLRLILQPYRAAMGLFDQHTRYAFASREALRAFHRDLVAHVLNAYWQANGLPEVLVVKDPLLTPHLALVHEMIPAAEIILILRHPLDVIASRLVVQDRLGVARDPDRILGEHNAMLESVLETWDACRPQVVTYPQLGQPGLQQIRRASSLDDLDPDRLWLRSRKDQEVATVWQTRLVGAPIDATRRPLDLKKELVERIEILCLPLCMAILERAKIAPGPYWAAQSSTEVQSGADVTHPATGRPAGWGHSSQGGA